MRTMIILAALVASLNAPAQEWCPPGAEWWYEQWGSFGSQVGFVHVHYSSDTLINGIYGQKLEAIASGYDFIAQQSYSQPLQPIITSWNNQSVSYWDGSQWILFVDLSIPPGGQWVLPMDGNDVFVYVQDTGLLEVSGQLLRYSVVDFTPSFGFQTDTIIEYIGYKKVFLDPRRTFVIDNDILGLRCYVDEIITYTTDLSPQCDFIVEVSEQNMDKRIILGPNPIQDFINVSLPENANYSLVVQDVSGRQVYTKAQASGYLTIDMSSMNLGIYLITINSSNGTKIGHWKLVKQTGTH